MSDADVVAAALVGLRLRERELELDACAIRARVEEIRDLIGLLEHGTRRRPGKPRNRPTVLEMPDRVAGGIHTPETEETAA
jgi:hypothetical protein